MTPSKPGGATCAAFALFSVGLSAIAEEAPCPARMAPAEAVRCALATNLDVKRVRGEQAVLAARRTTASVTLPSYPVLEGSVAGRWAATDSAFDAYLQLRQELEFGGKKQARLDEVDAEAAALVRRIAVTEGAVAAEVLSAYYEFVATYQQIGLAALVVELADRLEAWQRARVQSELLAPMEGRVLAAEVSSLRGLALSAKRAHAIADAHWRLDLGSANPESRPDGGLEPLAIPDLTLAALVERALTVRGEIAAADQEIRVFQARAAVLERLGTPNLSVLLIAQRDGFRETVLGAGVSVPIAFPSSLGPSRAGEVAEARAQEEQARLDAEAVRRRVRGEVERAFAEWQGRKAEAELVSPALVEGARRDHARLAEELEAGRISPRDALTTWRSLVELLQRGLETRGALALASVELTRAAGLPWPGAVR